MHACKNTFTHVYTPNCKPYFTFSLILHFQFINQLTLHLVLVCHSLHRNYLQSLLHIHAPITLPILAKHVFIHLSLFPKLYPTLRMDVTSYLAVLTAPFCNRLCIFPRIDIGTRVSVLPNIRHAVTSRPFSKWD